MGHTARVSLRVNPDIDARSHPFISTGLRHSKFGVDIDDAVGIFERATRLVGVRLVGVQSHIGSQITEVAPMAAAAQAVVDLSRDLLKCGFPLETINVGGGLGIDYHGDGHARACRPGRGARAGAVDRLPLTVLLEPGRSIVGPAGVLLTRTLYRKQNHGREFVVVDAGINDLLRPALYGAFHRIEPVQPRGRGTIVADIVGPVCESGDFLARERELEAVEAGDLLVVRDAGAYGFSMSSNYNMRPRAAEVLVRGGRPQLVRRRETFEDLVATELSLLASPRSRCAARPAGGASRTPSSAGRRCPGCRCA